MKIKHEHFEVLKAAIVPLDTEKHRDMYRQGKFHNADKVKDLNKRYRWDLLYASNLKIGDGVGIDGLPLYEYMDGNHIDTALKKIVPIL